jgi:cation:H+ antiporter
MLDSPFLMTFVQLVVGFILLIFGAEYLVRGAVALARRLSVSPLIIGMTIVSWGTTSPELVVSLQAAIDNLPGISIGNVVGSNICNILLILGLSAVIFPIVVPPSALYRDGAMMLGTALLFCALALTGTIERWQAAIMVGLLIAFTLYAFRTEMRKGAADGGQVAEDEVPPGPVWLALLQIVGGVASVVTGAKLLVAAAVATANHFKVPEEVIGLTIVAVGTSLPELATAVVAALRRQSAIAVGNIMGAGMYNILMILGLVGLIVPIPVPEQIIRFDMWAMVVVTVILLAFLLLRGGLSRPVGAMFLTGFVTYTALQYYGVDKVMGSPAQITGISTASAR